MAAPVDNVFSTVFQLFSIPDNECGVRLNHLLSISSANKILSQQSQSGIQDLLSYTHRSLGSSKSRLVGVALLGEVVAQCSTEVFQQSALTWTTLLLQVLQSRCQAAVYEKTCQILAQIFHFAKNFSDISREIISSVIPQLVPLLLTASTKVRSAAVGCLNAIILTYPGPLAPFKNKIQASVLSAVDAGSKDKEILRCFALLPQIGPGGSMGVKHAEAWALLCQQVLGSLENSLASLYDGLETESSKAAKGRAELPITSIDPDQSGRVTSLVSRFLCLTDCLGELLSEGPETAVKVPLGEILQLVCRCLAVNCKMLLSRPSTERVYLSAHLSSIHIGAWNILKQMIVTCRSLLLPHHGVIAGLFSQELLWTSTEKSGHTIQYSQLRQTVYEAIALWLKTLHGNSGIAGEEKTLVKQILQDCAPVTDTLKLAGHSQDSSEQTSKKKKKHKGYQEISQGISSQRKIHYHANQGLVVAALEALYWMVITSGSELDKQTLQDVQKFCVRTLLSLQQAVVHPVPYISVDCRRNLYRVLHACTMTSHAVVAPPTQCAYGVFRAGLQDKSLEVSCFCIEALRSCELLIHPRAPCLNGPVICETLVCIGDGNTTAGSVSTNGFGHDEETTESHVADSAYLFKDSYTQKQTGSKSDGPLHRKRTAGTDVDAEDEANAKQARLDATDNSSGSLRNAQSAGKGSVEVVDGKMGKEGSDNDDNDEDDEDDDDQDMDDGIQQVNTSEDRDGNKPDAEDEGMASLAASSEIYVATKLDSNVDGTGKAKVQDEEEVSLIDEEVVELSSESETAEKETSDKKAGPEVEAVLMTFVDAEPDSD